jgi:ketose-bisphosphate aldolase
MLDYSARPYAENVSALAAVVRKARPFGITVEGEIGHVGKVDTVTAEGTGASTLTLPAEAAAYATETGVDALAVSIGNAHGQYTKLPRFDFDRLAAIREVVQVPLVLHGGSGTPDEDLKKAISLGIAKVNVATDLVTTIRESLRQQWSDGRNLWLPPALAEATHLIAPVVERWIRRTGAAGRA